MHGGTKFDLGLVALLFPKAPYQDPKNGQLCFYRTETA